MEVLQKVVFLWETLSSENRLFHPFSFWTTLSPIIKAGTAQTMVKKKIHSPTLIFLRGAVAKLTFMSPRCYCIITLEYSEN